MERDARRTERFAVLIPEARLPSLTEKQQAILRSWRRAAGIAAAELRRKELPSRRCRRWCGAGWCGLKSGRRRSLGGLTPTMTEPFS